MQRIRSKTQELNRRLQPYCKERQSAMQDFKLENLLTPKDCLTLHRSQIVQKIFIMLNEIDNLTVEKYNREDALGCRNYLMFMLCITNALRASNLINLTIADIKNAVHDAEFDAMVIKSAKYKTSMLYGKKCIVVSEQLLSYIMKFCTYLRPMLVGPGDAKLSDEERVVFLSTQKGGSKMNHSAISNGMSQLFQMVPELKSKKR